jgi:hypothetical protein
MAGDLGMRLESSESLNIDPAFINCLKDIVLKKLEEIQN